jgi:SAM-dependent methyltransferase
MPTLQQQQQQPEPHRARYAAESFGADPERYDRTRPAYPQGLIDHIITASHGRDLLDVGIGTGISAHPFAAAGFRVLGVEADARMAEFASRRGFQVETDRFEDWDPAGRKFDLMIAGMTWHWLNPATAAAKASLLLRPNGLAAPFWNVHQPPPELAEAFSAVYRRVLPGTPFAAAPRDSIAGYSRILDTSAAGFQEAGVFTVPERLRFDWERSYSTDEWLDQVPTFGGHSILPPAKLDELLSGIRAAVEEHEGVFTMRYGTLALTAYRRDDAS